MKAINRRAAALICWLAAWALPAQAGADGQREYVIGGGDSLQVNVWKNAELSQSVVVRPDGKITLPLVRDVQAEGLTALKLGEVLAEKFSSFINAPNVTVTVAAATGYKVYTQGAIANGTYTLASPVTARQLLSRAGGAAPEADPARAHVLRGNERIPVNLSIAGSGRGTAVDELILAPGDILEVPVREVTLGRVLVVGEVNQPNALAHQPGMTILDAYLGAGGGTAAADLTSVRVARQQESGNPVEIPVDLEEVLKKGALRTNIALEPGDIVIVPFREPAERILVVGEVRAPRTIAYREGLTLLDAFVESGGGTDYADLDSVKVVRASEGGKREELGVDLERILKKADVSRNIPLAPGDIVMVPR